MSLTGLGVIIPRGIQFRPSSLNLVLHRKIGKKLEKTAQNGGVLQRQGNEGHCKKQGCKAATTLKVLAAHNLAKN